MSYVYILGHACTVTWNVGLLESVSVSIFYIRRLIIKYHKFRSSSISEVTLNDVGKHSMKRTWKKQQQQETRNVFLMITMSVKAFVSTVCAPVCSSLLWRHNGRDGVSNHQSHDCLLNCSLNYSGLDERKHQSSASLSFVLGMYRWPMNSPHKWPATWKMFPFNGVIMMAPSFQLAILPCWRSRLLRSWNHTGQSWVCL